MGGDQFRHAVFQAKNQDVGVDRLRRFTARPPGETTYRRSTPGCSLASQPGSRKVVGQ